jgi:hypothetical protein
LSPFKEGSIVSEQEYRGSRYASREDVPGGRGEGFEGREDAERAAQWPRREDRTYETGGPDAANRDFRGRGPRGYQRSSERIEEDVCEWLTDDADVDASDIEVEVENGIVTLGGSVADRRQKRRAEDVAEQARGVRDVRNQLEIGDRELVDDLTGRVRPRQEEARSGADALGEYRDPRWRSVDFRGFDADARDGSIGSIDERSEVGADHLVVDTGPWIFGKKVVLPVGLIERVDVEERRVFVSRAKDEIKNAPEFSDERLDDPSYGAELRAYYGGERVERSLR